LVSLIAEPGACDRGQGVLGKHHQTPQAEKCNIRAWII
jgi:hypothetical protein